jgi:hypothetical protein|tara:strand:+ start:645 stop:833 length:189 start_codon:yes stop_codon:yes gene_type:complete
MIDVQERMKELCKPVEQQIMMCDSREEILMMACAMLTHVKTMLDSQIGIDGRKQIIKEANND